MGSRKLETRRARPRIFFQHLVLAALLAFAAGEAAARHNPDHTPGNEDPGKQGPKASLSSSTTCAIDDDTVELVVTTSLEDKSGGVTVPEVRSGTIAGSYKQKGGGGSITEFPMGGKDICDLDPSPCGVEVGGEPFLIEARFSLCELVVDGILVARELNGESVVNYGISGGSEDPRTVENRCTDDPDTPENEGGIKVDAATKEAIEEACGP